MTSLPTETIISSKRSTIHYWRDLWQYRELFYFLSWRDLLVRYKQTIIGVLWAILRPFLTMIIFTVVFGNFAKLPSGGVPYAILVFAALLPWQFFSSALTETSSSLVTNSNMLTKIYFPRLIIPASTIIVSVVDFLISFLILIALMIWYKFAPGWQISILPVFLLLALIVTLGTGIWFAALNVKYRDFRFIVPFIVQLGMYITPVGFSSSIVPDKWRLLYSFNPMVGVIDGFRWAILDGNPPLYIPGLIISCVAGILILAVSLMYFRKVEDTIADII